jgi:AcrR family transcriptional regulator
MDWTRLTRARATTLGEATMDGSAGRRGELADAVCRVMAARGVQGTTMREVARDAGWTTGALVHHFGDKAGMIEFASEMWMQRAFDNAADAIGTRIGLAALHALLASDLGDEDPAADEDLRIWHSMIEAASRDDRLAAQWRGLYETYRNECERLLREAIDAGEIPSTCDVETAAAALIATVDGLNIRQLVDPERFTTDVQLRVLDQVLASLQKR